MSDIDVQKRIAETAEWNEYWSKGNNGGIVYSLIATFYRKVIIRPNLNRFIRKYFEPGANLLHAGCGSGQVDVDIRDYARITGLDISAKALEVYQESNEGKCATLRGSIFDIPLPSESVDGIYNLGVMEHFTQEEISRILAEFRRVLKREGKIVLFWPPEYGLSVIFFKVLRGIIKLFFAKDVKFHPDEVSRVQSRKSVSDILQRAGFKVLEYSFGPRDAWTYSIIVGGKAA